MFLSAQLRRLTLCRLIGSQWRRDHRQPDCGRAPPENLAFEVRHGLFGWRKAADSPIGRRASSACRVTSGLEGPDGPSEARHSSRNEHRERGPSATRRRFLTVRTAPLGEAASSGQSRPPGGRAGRATHSRLEGGRDLGRARLWRASETAAAAPDDEGAPGGSEFVNSPFVAANSRTRQAGRQRRHLDGLWWCSAATDPARFRPPRCRIALLPG